MFLYLEFQSSKHLPISREFKKWTDVCSQTFFKKQNFCNYPSCGIILYSCFFDAIIGLFRHSITCELVLFHHVIFSRKQLSPTAPRRCLCATSMVPFTQPTILRSTSAIEHYRIIVKIFLITIAGRELAGGFRQTTNGEIFWMNGNYSYLYVLKVTCMTIKQFPLIIIPHLVNIQFPFYFCFRFLLTYR